MCIFLIREDSDVSSDPEMGYVFSIEDGFPVFGNNKSSFSMGSIWKFLVVGKEGKCWDSQGLKFSQNLLFSDLWQKYASKRGKYRFIGNEKWHQKKKDLSSHAHGELLRQSAPWVFTLILERWKWEHQELRLLPPQWKIRPECKLKLSKPNSPLYSVQGDQAKAVWTKPVLPVKNGCQTVF